MILTGLICTFEDGAVGLMVGAAISILRNAMKLQDAANFCEVE